MISSPPKTGRTDSTAGLVIAISVTAALSVLMLGTAVPAIRPWSPFLAAILFLVSLGGALSVLLLRALPAAPGSLPKPGQQGSIDKERAGFVKGLGAPASWGQEVGRAGTAAQTAYY